VRFRIADDVFVVIALPDFEIHFCDYYRRRGELQFARMQVQTDMPEQMLPFVATHRHKIPPRRSVIVSRQADGTVVGFHAGRVGTENFLTLRFGSVWNILTVFSIFDL